MPETTRGLAPSIALGNGKSLSWSESFRDWKESEFQGFGVAQEVPG